MDDQIEMDELVNLVEKLGLGWGSWARLGKLGLPCLVMRAQ